MIMKKLMNNKWFSGALILLLGIIAGLLIGSRSGDEPGHEEHLHDHEHETHAVEEWTCSMHPQIRQDEPGDCPICGMELIPVSTDRGREDHDPMVLRMSPEAIAMASVQTSRVEKSEAEKVLGLTGKVRYNEQSVSNVTSSFPGRVEELYVNFTGQQVKKGEPLARLYSPELVTAQKELLEAAGMKESYPGLYASAREKLRQWRLSEGQVDEIEKSGSVKSHFDVLASNDGTVTGRMVANGDYVGTGTVLFEIADLRTVWVMVDAYENDLAWIGTGDRVEFSLPAIPGEEFNGRVGFIDPFIDDGLRTARVRAEVSNPGLKLKPGMFVNARITSRIGGGEQSLLIPRTALLWTGKRSVVYVKVPGSEEPAFEMREVVIGPRMGEKYLVESGLDEGEEIVTNGVFAIDAAAQLTGNYSMMSRPPVKTYEVPEQFRSQLTDVVEEYFYVKDALVDSDPATAASATGDLVSALGRTDMSLLEDEPHHRWMEILDGLRSASKMILDADDLEEQRIHFEMLSDNMTEAVEYFGVLIDRVYRMYCPMAFENKGAYWLSNEEEVLNPYFGEAMLRCGEITQTYRRGSRVFEMEEEAPAPPQEHIH